MIYILQFFGFSFLGWIMDSLTVSFYRKKWVASGYFKGVPLCPLYGIGGIMLLKSFEFFQNSPFYISIFLSTIFMVAYEYVSCWLGEIVLHKKLWDYSDHKPNLHGRISLWQSFLWLILVSILYWILYKIAI